MGGLAGMGTATQPGLPVTKVLPESWRTDDTLLVSIAFIPLAVVKHFPIESLSSFGDNPEERLICLTVK
jgi:hypothetical protein